MALSTDMVYIIILYPAGPIRIIVPLKNKLARFVADAFPQIICKCKELKKTQRQLENITSIISVSQYIFSFLQHWVMRHKLATFLIKIEFIVTAVG